MSVLLCPVVGNYPYINADSHLCTFIYIYAHAYRLLYVCICIEHEISFLVLFVPYRNKIPNNLFRYARFKVSVHVIIES